jgi:chorismate mutase
LISSGSIWPPTAAHKPGDKVRCGDLFIMSSSPRELNSNAAAMRRVRINLHLSRSSGTISIPYSGMFAYGTILPIARSVVLCYNVLYGRTTVSLRRTWYPNMAAQEKFYLVREDILPEGVLKAAQAKELLARGEARTIHDAVEHVGLSRSAYYKYKDGIFPYSKMERERIATVSMDLEHRSGILSKVLALIANHEGNVLTIHQTIPLSGMANVVISVDTSGTRVYRSQEGETNHG